MRIYAAIALFILWLVLSASYDLIHVIAGAVTASIVVLINPKGASSTQKFSWLSALSYLPWLFFRIIKSGFHVCKLILQPSLPIQPELVVQKTKLKSDGELVVLGNSITLTPGTITVEIAPGEIIVHAIDASSQQDLVNGVLDERIGRLFASKEGVQ